MQMRLSNLSGLGSGATGWHEAGARRRWLPLLRMPRAQDTAGQQETRVGWWYVGQLLINSTWQRWVFGPSSFHDHEDTELKKRRI